MRKHGFWSAFLGACMATCGCEPVRPIEVSRSTNGWRSVRVLNYPSAYVITSPDGRTFLALASGALVEITDEWRDTRRSPLSPRPPAEAGPPR